MQTPKPETHASLDTGMFKMQIRGAKRGTMTTPNSIMVGGIGLASSWLVGQWKFKNESAQMIRSSTR